MSNLTIIPAAKVEVIDNPYVGMEYEAILDKLVKDCKKLGVIVNRECIEQSDSRASMLAVNDRHVRPSNSKFQVELPGKFGAYQNYLGGGMRGSYQKVDVEPYRVFTSRGTQAKQEDAQRIAKAFNDAGTLFIKAFKAIRREDGDWAITSPTTKSYPGL